VGGGYRHPEYLISPADLASALGAPDLRIFDCTVHLLPNPPRYRIESGHATYLEGHLPGAAFLDLTGPLSDSRSTLAFTLPPPPALEAALRAAGIDDDSQVVLYARGHVMWATRVWWMLHGAGHERIAVLDGGFAGWVAAGLPVETGEAPPRPPGRVTVRHDPRRWADRAEVLAATDGRATCTINALSPGVYSGTSAMSYGRKGHIPGSVNVHYERILDGDHFRSADDIRAAFAGVGALDGRRVVTYCGGGISATVDALALKLIGLDDVAVYDGSMSEWAADPTLPLGRGLRPKGAPSVPDPDQASW
jgi:thiosulfate/3-mercaptopyruvate sulfurtransferase